MNKFNKRTFLKYAAGGLAAATPVYASLAASGTEKMPLSKEATADGDTVQYLFVQ